MIESIESDLDLGDDENYNKLSTEADDKVEHTIAEGGDVVFVVGADQVRLRVHSFIVKSHSPYFKQLLDNQSFSEDADSTRTGLPIPSLSSMRSRCWSATTSWWSRIEPLASPEQKALDVVSWTFREIMLPYHDPLPLRDLFCLMHTPPRVIPEPSTPTASQLLQLSHAAVQCQCSRLLRDYARNHGWLGCEGVLDRERLWALMITALRLKEHQAFERLTKALILRHSLQYEDLWNETAARVTHMDESYSDEKEILQIICGT
jgi:hypothetical protein